MPLAFDMDGVLANFNRAALVAHGAEDLWEKDERRGPECWDTPKLLGITPSEFWEPLKDANFWSSLDRYKDGMSMFMYAYMNYDEYIYILTAPYPCAGCYAGKFMWFDKWLRGSLKYGQLVMTSDKYMFATDDSILVDDNSTNCRLWKEAGGHAFLVGRPWNERHFAEDINLPLFRDFMEEKQREFETKRSRQG